MNSVPRVAFFTDSFHEINGVAHTSRHFDAFARRRRLPFLNIHAGARTVYQEDGPVCTLELARTGVGFQLEQDMSFDLLFPRHRASVREHVKKFGADLVHITGPSDVGILGAAIAYDLKLPLIASWHTNIHEFGARRLTKMLRFLPAAMVRKIAAIAEDNVILALTLRYYRLGKVLLAPNPELVAMLQERTSRPTFLMQRGVDTEFFSPEKRSRASSELIIGYVGRLSPEKSVRALRDVEESLLAAGVRNFRFLVVGDGHERAWLEANLQNVECTGVLRGEALAQAYANMDIFAFPSATDTYGNVVLEAMASGVPPVVTNGGGPKYLVTHGVTGLVSSNQQSFLENIALLAGNPNLVERMRTRAREFALCRYWHRIFEQVYDAYHYCLHLHTPAGSPAPAIERTVA